MDGNGISKLDIFIKEEITDETEPTVPRIDIKEEERSNIYHGGLVHVKQEEELLVPDDVSASGIQEEERMQSFCGPKSSLNEIDHLKGKMDFNLSVMYLHTDEKPHPCEYEAIIPDNFKSHKCPHCSYKTANTSHLKRHIMACHTGEKPHQCHHCSYKTTNTSHLKRHIMACHTGEKPHQCPHCNYETNAPENLKKHIMARHTGEKPHQCSHCSYKTTNTSHLKRHIMSHHTLKKCPHCEYKTALLNNLYLHTKARH